MVDNSTGPLQMHFGPVFYDEAVQADLLFSEWAASELFCGYLHQFPQHIMLLPSGWEAYQAESGGMGYESTSHAVHRRWVLPVDSVGVCCQ
jgi:hypothetical protein